MADPAHGVPAPSGDPDDRLDSWKEIAAYLSRDVTTVQRWEKREGMPVHRHQHDKKGSVYAFRAELDAWASSRNVIGAVEVGSPVSSLPTTEIAAPGTAEGQHRKRSLIPLIAAILAVLIGASWWAQRKDYFWRSPIARATIQAVTDFDGVEQAAAISGDGKFIAFLSDREGKMDVWLTQVGSGQFHNLTAGKAPELVNQSVRMLGFTPDGAFVTYWVRPQAGPDAGRISVWAVPTLGGQPKPYFEGIAEYAWSRDGSRLVYHTAGPGDPLFVTDGTVRPEARAVFTAPEGLHSHYPVWSPDGRFIYFVQGALPDKLDIWRIPPNGGSPERVTSSNSRVTYPVFVDANTLMYLASDPDGAGPWLYGMDVRQRIAHRLTSGPERYTSISVSADGHRLALTLATPKRTLWWLPLSGTASAPSLVPLTTSSGFAPRLGPDYLIYVSITGKGESIWKLSGGTTTELWRGKESHVVGGPSISPDGGEIAFSAQQGRHSVLYVMQADGTNARVVSDSLKLQGNPAWSPGGKSITIAAEDQGVPHLFRVPLDRHSPMAMVHENSIDGAWAPDGTFVVYSGPDVGTTFSVKAANTDGTPHSLPPLTLTRGARRLVFLPGKRSLVFLKGDIRHKDLWLLDLDTGVERPLTQLPRDFDIRDFDVSPDGNSIVLEREQDDSDIVLMDIPKR